MNRLMFDLVTDTALKHRLDPDLLLAIVMKESEGDQWRVRYEPHYRWLYFPREWASRLRISFETEEVLQKTSFGPGQVMGAVAREYGYDDLLTKLPAFPDLALTYSARLLAWLRTQCHEESEVIACYNGGLGAKKKTPGGHYLNQAYVNDVHQHLIRLRRLA